MFTRSTMLPALGKVCVTRILTLNLLAALKFLLKLIVTFRCSEQWSTVTED